MDDNVSSGGDWNTIEKLITLIKPYKNWVILSITCAVVIGVCDVISVTFIR